MSFQRIQTKLSTEDDQEYDDTECPSSADIEVVHTRETPPLHSILKQRSTSESSEGPSSSSSGESPTGLSPREIDGQKKEVHFNSHVDKTTFKSNLSVSSMKVALKSKRRRQRKREEKKAEKIERSRRRHNSTGSECSSCDEHDSKLSAESHSEDDHDDLSQQMDEAGKKVSENGVIIEDVQAEKRAQKENYVKVNIPVKGNDEIKGNKHDLEKPVKGDESTEGIKTKMTKGNKLVQDIKKKLAEKDEISVVNDSDDDAEDGCKTPKFVKDVVKTSDENAQKIVDKTTESNEMKADSNDLIEKSFSIEATASDKQKAADCLTDDSGTSSAMIGQNLVIEQQNISELESKDVKKLENGMHEKDDDMNENESVIKNAVRKSKKQAKPGLECENDKVVDNKNVGQRECEKNEFKNENMVETELSWKETDRAAPNHEHRTECAFSFSNVMMFDLDID